MSYYNKYVISVCTDRHRDFSQYMNSLDMGHIHKLPTKITKNKHWIGAGLSHKDCVRHAMVNNCDHAMVFEDDCRFFPDHKNVLNSVLDYIDKNDNWEYICLSHTFIYNIGRALHAPNIDSANDLMSQCRFKRVNDVLIEIDLNDIHDPVIANSCCVIYNNTVYEKYLNEFDPYQREWCDTWAPKHLKTLIVTPVIAYQHGKPWMKEHCDTWSDFINNIK